MARRAVPQPHGERDLARPGCQNPGADIGEFPAHGDHTGHHYWNRLLQGNGLVSPEARVSRVPHPPDIHRRTGVRQPNACRSDQMHGQPLNASRCGSAETRDARRGPLVVHSGGCSTCAILSAGAARHGRRCAVQRTASRDPHADPAPTRRAGERLDLPFLWSSLAPPAPELRRHLKYYPVCADFPLIPAELR